MPMNSRRDDAACKTESTMRRLPIFIVIAAFIGCSPASAQMSGTSSSSPGMGATSQLGAQSGSTIQPTGIGLGATEMVATGTSPAPTLATSGLMPGNTICSSATSAMSQTSTALFDGGGPSGATSTACAATDGTATSTPTASPLQAGRSNIPLGSTEISNLGISSATSVPLSPTVSSTMGGAVPCPTTGMSISSSSSTGMSVTASGC